MAASGDHPRAKVQRSYSSIRDRPLNSASAEPGSYEYLRPASADEGQDRSEIAALSRDARFMVAINKGGKATVTLPGVFALPGGVPIKDFQSWLASRTEID
jgi:hypothetical protein